MTFRVPKNHEDDFCDAVRRAVQAQLVMWDAMSDAEALTFGDDPDAPGADIQSDNIASLSAELARPDEVDALSNDTILEWFKSTQPPENTE